MPSIKKPLVAGAIALFVILALIVVCFLLLKRTVMAEDTAVSGSIKSPDGVYKAVVFNTTGGGGGWGYCFDAVSVVPTPDDKAWDVRHVFDAACDDDLLSRVVWTSPRHLQITFNPTQAVQGIDAVTLRGYAGKDAEVEISYAMAH
jgi:hypothetical protein